MELIWQGCIEACRLIASLDQQVLGAAFRSLWISTLAVLCATAVGLPLGLLLARRNFLGRGILILLARVGMALPTVFIGLICFALFSKRGILGNAELIFTPWAIVCGEFMLGLPIIVSLSHGAFRELDPRVGETAWTLGAGLVCRCRTYLSEARTGVVLSILTAFSRCVTELGIAMMVGGNIKNATRTLSTATALEVSKGEFGRALAVGFILLLLAMGVTVAIVRMTNEESRFAWMRTSSFNRRSERQGERQ